MIYFDGTHLASDNGLAELHMAAQRLGLKREWFQDHPRHPHYDLLGRLARKMEPNCTSRELVQRCYRDNPAPTGENDDLHG